MGTPATGYIKIIFKEVNDNLRHIANMKPLQFSDFLNNYEEGYFGIYNLHLNDNELNLELESGRIQNAEWQCDIIYKYFTEKFKGQLAEFSADIATSENHIFEIFDDEEDEL